MTDPLGTPTIGERQAIAAIQRFIADYDDGDRADAGNYPLMEAHVADFRAILSLDSPSLGEGVAAHALRDALDKLGYTKVFRAIGDAVKWREHRGIEISVEQLIFALTGIDQDNARYLTKIRSEEVATPTTNAPVADLREAIARIEHVFDTIPCYASLVADDVRLLIDAILSLTKTATHADMRGALESIANGAANGEAEFRRLMSSKKSLTWLAVNVLQDNLAACAGTARTVLQGDQS